MPSKDPPECNFPERARRRLLLPDSGGPRNTEKENVLGETLFGNLGIYAYKHLRKWRITQMYIRR
jgi:hypothetical protein